MCGGRDSLRYDPLQPQKPTDASADRGIPDGYGERGAAARTGALPNRPTAHRAILRIVSCSCARGCARPGTGRDGRTGVRDSPPTSPAVARGLSHPGRATRSHRLGPRLDFECGSQIQIFIDITNAAARLVWLRESWAPCVPFGPHRGHHSAHSRADRRTVVEARVPLRRAGSKATPDCRHACRA